MGRVRRPIKLKLRRQGREDSLQAAIVRFHNKNVSPDQAVVFHVPNGGKRGRITGSILKGMGVLAGVADLILVTHSKVTFVELKREIRGEDGKTTKTYQSPPQKDFQRRVSMLGHEYVVVRTVQEYESLLHRLGLICYSTEDSLTPAASSKRRTSSSAIDMQACSSVTSIPNAGTKLAGTSCDRDSPVPSVTRTRKRCKGRL